MSENEWSWSRLSRTEVRDHGRSVVDAAVQREGFETQTAGAIVHATRGAQTFEAHVRTLRNPVYAFWEKRRFELSTARYAALVLLVEGRPPATYLAPSLAWREPNELFVSRDYENRASEPEWGMNLSGRTLPLLEQYRIARVLRGLTDPGERARG